LKEIEIKRVRKILRKEKKGRIRMRKYLKGRDDKGMSLKKEERKVDDEI
jgi:hypothetical protein